MAEILKYRIPGKEKVEQTGFFREVDDLKNVKGFVLTTFLRDHTYCFTALENAKEQFYYSIEKPYVVAKSEYLNEAASFLEAFEKLKIEKAVFSRVKAVEFNEKKASLFFSNLCDKYPKAFVYLVSSELFGTWIGTTPEVLLQTYANTGFTISLAGTLLNNDKEEWSGKERNEQQLVTDFIEQKLEYAGIKNAEKIGPYSVEAGPVKHLRTDFSFDLGGVKAFDIVKLLHPTPAVSGLPQKTAIDLINFREPHERILYTGVVGWIGADQTGLYVNLRCCQLQKGTAFLYLGGGFTTESEPEVEWQETENKSLTLIEAMNL